MPRPSGSTMAENGNEGNGRGYGTGRVAMPEVDRSNMEEIQKGQFVQYAFYKIDPSWRLLSVEARAEQKQRAVELVESFQDEVKTRAYTLVGIRADADLLLWNVAGRLEALQRLGTALLSTELGAYLRPAYLYLAVTKRSIYVSKHAHAGQDGQRLRIRPSGAKYLFVYPFVKTRPWYKL